MKNEDNVLPWWFSVPWVAIHQSLLLSARAIYLGHSSKVNILCIFHLLSPAAGWKRKCFLFSSPSTTLLTSLASSLYHHLVSPLCPPERGVRAKIRKFTTLQHEKSAINCERETSWRRRRRNILIAQAGQREASKAKCHKMMVRWIESVDSTSLTNEWVDCTRYRKRVHAKSERESVWHVHVNALVVTGVIRLKVFDDSFSLTGNKVTHWHTVTWFKFTCQLLKRLEKWRNDWKWMWECLWHLQEVDACIHDAT